MDVQARWTYVCIALSALTLTAPEAFAQSSGEGTNWSVDGDFADDTLKDLSGATCAPTDPPLQICIIANDEESLVQFFTGAEGTIKPGSTSALPSTGGEIDAEGAAFDPASGHFYVTGSHGRTRNSNDEGVASYLIHRFKVDSQTLAVEAVESTDVLRKKMKDMKDDATGGSFASFFDHPLAENGANIEGIAVGDGRIWLGFRAPVVETSGADRAFILSVAVDSIFGDGELDPRIHEVALGPGMGIRDLVAVGDGFLILTGPAKDELGKAEVLWWDGAAQTPQQLLRIDESDMPSGGKPETALMLGETGGQYRVMILFDGEKNGKPREYVMTR